MMLKKMLLIGLCLSMASVFVISADMAGAAATLKLGTSQPDKGGFLGDMPKIFAEEVEKGTDGKVKVKVFYSGALSSNERELAEMTQSGAIDFGIAATTYILGWAPSLKVFDLPYLYQGVDHYQKVIQGEVGQFLAQQVEDDGVKLVAYILPGIRSIFNNKKPINTLEDCKGLKIRSMQSPVYIEMFKAMGMLPTPMPSSELYTSLQLGVVDAGENDPASVVSWGWIDVIKYYSLDQHSIAVCVLLMNKDKFDSFDEATQKAILAAARKAENYQIEYISGAWEESLKKIKARGVEVNEIADKSAFQNAVKHIVDKYDQEIGHGLVQQVRAAAK